MELNEYQLQAMSTLLPSCDNMAYSLTGMAAEVGEVIEKVWQLVESKKLIIHLEWDESLLAEDVAKMRKEYDDICRRLKNWSVELYLYGRNTEKISPYRVLRVAVLIGEINDKIAKWVRKDYLHITFEWDKSFGEADVAKMINELCAEVGDVQWFVAHMSKQLYRNLDEIGKQNLIKLADRKKRGVIDGSGDHR